MSQIIKHGSYGQFLLGPEWREKRRHIIERDNGKCVICGSTEELIVHHKQYHINSKGQKYFPWCYEDKYLITICKKCHIHGHARFNVPIFIIDK
ncbi:MAG: HNH endonuclease [Muribaculum sp.]|nr:HNH endonuclease [Muribaculum sp.]MCM1577059.1 HNH endonuclease [Bacteroides sp.]